MAGDPALRFAINLAQFGDGLVQRLALSLQILQPGAHPARQQAHLLKMLRIRII